MSDKTRRMIAWEVWNDLTALLDDHPTLITELTAEHQQAIAQSGAQSSWMRDLLAGLEIVQYPSMSAASKGLNLTPLSVQRRLEAVRKGDNCVAFRKWIRQNPALFDKIIRRFGLNYWPYLQCSFGKPDNPLGEDAEALLPLVVHSDVAALLADRFTELRDEIAKLSDKQ